MRAPATPPGRANEAATGESERAAAAPRCCRSGGRQAPPASRCACTTARLRRPRLVLPQPRSGAVRASSPAAPSEYNSLDSSSRRVRVHPVCIARGRRRARRIDPCRPAAKPRAFLSLSFPPRSLRKLAGPVCLARGGALAKGIDLSRRPGHLPTLCTLASAARRP